MHGFIGILHWEHWPVLWRLQVQLLLLASPTVLLIMIAALGIPRQCPVFPSQISTNVKGRCVHRTRPVRTSSRAKIHAASAVSARTACRLSTKSATVSDTTFAFHLLKGKNSLQRLRFHFNFFLGRGLLFLGV